ncbi:MAG: DUF1549 and DUF1553 domain-containing protein [Planctomycetota bacterium]
MFASWFHRVPLAVFALLFLLAAPAVAQESKPSLPLFEPLTRPDVPAMVSDAWVRQAPDAFVLARLQAAGLQPNGDASRRTLLRRASYSVTGLPPGPNVAAEFLSDEAPGAYERLIDRWLASPQYGERWGRHWLDLMRFAETNSFENDRVKPGAWRYRDWVIDALNSGMSYDEFLSQQIAGDEITPDDFSSIVATSWYRLGSWDFDPTDRRLAHYDDLDGVVSTVGQVFLGMTINCARCHDHKVDPISQRDYYGMLAFFRGLEPHVAVEKPGIRWDQLTVSVPGAKTREKAELERQEALSQMRCLEELVLITRPEEERAKIVSDAERRRLVETHGKNVLTGYQMKDYPKLRETLKRATNTSPVQPRIIFATETPGKLPTTHVLRRGNPALLGDEVEPSFPAVLQPPKATVDALPKSKFRGESSGRRRALATWITSGDNPLTARVFVNRLWQHHFGRGIVRSPNNFGALGRKATHPKLLDWLASEFIASDWDVKAMHRMILTSSTFRMSSRPSREALQKDATNELFSRFQMRRLSAEEIRDSIHAVNGSLNLKAGGPGFYTKMPLEILRTQSRPGHGWGFSPESERARRSIYIHVKRSLITPILASFDFADTDQSCPQRFSTTQPTQSLDTINGEFFSDQARVFAESLVRSEGKSPQRVVTSALQRAFQRPPTPKEIERGVKFLADMQSRHDASLQEALASYCLVVLNLNEFLYLD